VRGVGHRCWWKVSRAKCAMSPFYRSAIRLCADVWRWMEGEKRLKQRKGGGGKKQRGKDTKSSTGGGVIETHGNVLQGGPSTRGSIWARCASVVGKEGEGRGGKRQTNEGLK